MRNERWKQQLESNDLLPFISLIIFTWSIIISRTKWEEDQRQCWNNFTQVTISHHNNNTATTLLPNNNSTCAMHHTTINISTSLRYHDTTNPTRQQNYICCGWNYTTTYSLCQCSTSFGYWRRWWSYRNVKGSLFWRRHLSINQSINHCIPPTISKLQSINYTSQ